MDWRVWLSFLCVMFFPTPVRSAGGIDCGVIPTFSSEESIGKAVTAALRQTNRRIILALFGFNNDELARELVQLAKRGVIVQLKIDSAKANENKVRRLLARLREGGIEATPVAPDGRNHNKFAVIDGSRVLTGSYNWTSKAESNWENLLVLDCPELARRYEVEWEKIH